jgi:hypothetical protein
MVLRQLCVTMSLKKPLFTGKFPKNILSVGSYFLLVVEIWGSLNFEDQSNKFSINLGSCGSMMNFFKQLYRNFLSIRNLVVLKSENVGKALVAVRMDCRCSSLSISNLTISLLQKCRDSYNHSSKSTGLQFFHKSPKFCGPKVMNLCRYI